MADIRVKNLDAIQVIDKLNDVIGIEDVSIDETRKITIKEISGAIAGDGLNQNADGSLEVKTDNSTIEINTDALRVKNGGITPVKLAQQTKTVVNLTNPTPDYIGQFGRDSSGKVYVAIALTGTMWEQILKTGLGLEQTVDGSISPNLHEMSEVVLNEVNKEQILSFTNLYDSLSANTHPTSWGTIGANITKTMVENQSGIIPSTVIPKAIQIVATSSVSGSTFFNTPNLYQAGMTSILYGYWRKKSEIQALINAIPTESGIQFYIGQLPAPHYITFSISKTELQNFIGRKLFKKSMSKTANYTFDATFMVTAHFGDWIHFQLKVDNFGGTPNTTFQIYEIYNNIPAALNVAPQTYFNFTVLRNANNILPFAFYKDGIKTASNILTRGEFDTLKTAYDTNPILSGLDVNRSSRDLDSRMFSYRENISNYINKILGNNSTGTSGIAAQSSLSVVREADSSNEIINSSYSFNKYIVSFNNVSNNRWISFTAITLPTPKPTNIKYGFWIKKVELQNLVTAMSTGKIEFWIIFGGNNFIASLSKTTLQNLITNYQTYEYNVDQTLAGVTINKRVYCNAQTTNWMFLVYDATLISGNLDSFSTMNLYWLSSGDQAAFYANPQTLLNQIVLFDSPFIDGFITYKDSGFGFNNIITKEYVDSIYSQPSIKDKIRILKSGGNLYVRSYFNETKDVVIRIAISNNNLITNIYNTFLIASSASDSASIYVAGESIHGSSDDTCPWNTQNCGYIGGNHGFNASDVIVASHDKANADIGSLWSDGTGKEWYLTEIRSSTNLIFACKPYTYAGSWQTTTGTGSTLVHVSGATNTADVVVISQTALQMKPITLNHTVKILVDGKYDLIEDELTYGDFVDLIDQHDIVDPSTVTYSYPTAWNNGSPWIRNRITQRLQNYGAFILDYSAEILRELSLGYMGFIQSTKLNKGTYDKVFAYMPKVLINNGYDFKAIIDFTSNPSVSLNYTDAYLESTSNPPDRLIEFLGDNDGTKRVGYAHGYNIVYGHGKSASRDANNTNQWNIHTSGKSYPHCIDNLGIISTGYYHAIAYRQYFDPQLYPNTTCVYHHKIGNMEMVYIDIHQNVTNLKIQLPSFLTGKAITLVEKNSDLTLVSDELVTSDGVIVTVTNNYGYAVLKLS